MSDSVDLRETFVHLRDGGAAELLTPTPAFWRESTQGGHDRILGAFEFRRAEDLHPGLQEMHPEADELLLLLTGAIEVILDEPGGERSVSLSAGQVAIVPRGVWHRLVMVEPGTLVFVNSRTGMQSREVRS